MPPNSLPATATEGARLLAERLREFPSQAAVAEVLGCSQQTISGYLGRVRPDTVMRAVMRVALGIDDDAWFTDEERAQIEAARLRAEARKVTRRARRVTPLDSGRHPAARPATRTGTGG